MLRICLTVIMSLSVLGAMAEDGSIRASAGEIVENIACKADPTQTYTLYLPTTFENTRKWPVLLVFDPRGRSVRAAELFREAADRYGWIIVSSDNTRSDGAWEPNVAALKALWPEIQGRLPADPRRIYATGFSGGAAVAYLLARTTDEVAGIIACGGRYFPDHIEGTKAAIFATAGATDFNNDDMHLVAEFMEGQKSPGRIEIFDGGHSWMPVPVATEAVAWMELIAMQRGLREVDETFVALQWKTDLESVDSLVADGRELDASRRLREMEGTYDGLKDLKEMHFRAEDIEKSAVYRSQKKANRRSRSFWRDCRDNVNRTMTEMSQSEKPPKKTRLERDLRLKELITQSDEDGVMGEAAQQCLNTAYASLSFYLPRDLAAAERYADLATSYDLALSIRDNSPVIWYNLACARARLGRADDAVSALARALDLGFNQRDLMRTDSDLDSLRDRKDFKELLDR